jgi:hypothetical protein
LLTVRSIAEHNLRCIGVTLNDVSDDVATLTNADILRKILRVPLFNGLGKTLMELPADWRLMIDSTKAR